MPKVSSPNKTKLKLHNSSEDKKQTVKKTKPSDTNGKPTTSAPKLASITTVKTEREVQHPKIIATVCADTQVMTADRAKKLLGWQEESENIKFDEDNPHHILDTKGRKIRLTNNLCNRPFTLSNAMAWCQEVLMKRWELNGESIIVGEYGNIISGQHRAVGLIFANQIWEDKQGQYGELWPTAPVMETIIVYGIKETDKVINTVDTGKPRSLAEVIARSEHFSHYKKGDRYKLSKLTDYAVRVLWERTGAANAYSPRRTHAESLDFIARHPRMLEAVKHIYEENGNENLVGRYLAPGRSAALMYLMAGALTEREREDKQGYSDIAESTDASIKPSELQVDFELWEKASEFWVLLAGGDANMLAVRAAISDCITAKDEVVIRSTAIMVKAWLQFVEGEKITAASLKLDLITKEEEDYLNETPICGGIDLGKFKDI